MADMVIVAHKGKPCTPPVIDGLVFIPLGEDDIWVSEGSEEQVADLTRNPAYSRYGGGLPFPVSTDPEAAAAEAAAAQAAADEAAAAAKVAEQAAADEAAAADKAKADAEAAEAAAAAAQTVADAKKSK